MNFLPVSSVIGSLLLASTAAAQPFPRFIELGHSIESFEWADRFTPIDADGDGLKDAVFVAGWGDSQLLFVLGANADGSFGLKQSRLIHNVGGIAGVAAWSEKGATRIATVGASGTVRIYGGWPLADLGQVDTPTSLRAAAVGDVDADGIVDLVLLNLNGVEVRSLSAGELIRSFPAPPNTSDVALAQLDGDPALEIILGGEAPGSVVDGATGAVEWQSAIAFGTPLAVGVPGVNGLQRWAGLRFPDRAGFDVFGSAPWASIWNQPTEHRLRSIAMARNEDGSDLLVAGSQASEVVVFDVATQSVRLRIPSPSDYIAVTAVDLDGDGVDEIIFAPHDNTYPQPNLIVADGRTGVTLWSFASLGQQYAATAIGDVDADGREELIAASRNARDGNVVMSDFATGTKRWQSTGNAVAHPLPPIAVRTIELARRADTSQRSIVLAGSDPAMLNGPGLVVVLDPRTMAPVLQFGGVSNAIGGIRGTALYDYDGDGNDDLLTIEAQPSVFALPPRLAIYSLVDGTVLWSSDTLEEGPLGFKDVFVLPGASAGQDQFIAITDTGLTAFGRASSAAAWALPVNAADAAHVAQGVHGPEIVVLTQGGRLSFFDAATREALRTFMPGFGMGSLQVLDGRVDALLATSNEGLTLIDGRTGDIRALGPSLGLFTEMPKMGVADQGGDIWHLAPPSRAGTFRYRLELTDAVFGNGFDTVP